MTANISAYAVRVPVNAARAIETTSDPKVLTWPGTPKTWWQRNGWTVGNATIAGGLTAGTGAFYASELRFPGGFRARDAAIVAGAALGVGLLTAGIVHAVRRKSDEVPQRPANARIPSIPAGTPVQPVHGGLAPNGTTGAYSKGSYLESYQETHYRTNSDGERESYTTTEYRWEYFSWNIALQGQVGKREGYADVESALRDITAGDAVALRAQDGRIVTYDMESRSHWGDVDHLYVRDPQTVAIVSPGGRVWRQYGQEFGYGERVSRPDTTGIKGRSIGHYEFRYKSDPQVGIGTIRTGRSGLRTLEEAVGLMHARNGDQAVIERNGTFHVADAYASGVDRAQINDGFIVDANAQQVIVVEQQGSDWVPVGDWYMAPAGSR